MLHSHWDEQQLETAALPKWHQSCSVKSLPLNYSCFKYSESSQDLKDLKEKELLVMSSTQHHCFYIGPEWNQLCEARCRRCDPVSRCSSAVSRLLWWWHRHVPAVPSSQPCNCNCPNWRRATPELLPSTASVPKFKDVFDTLLHPAEVQSICISTGPVLVLDWYQALQSRCCESLSSKRQTHLCSPVSSPVTDGFESLLHQMSRQKCT